MLIQRLIPESYPLTLTSKDIKTIHYYWCSDGWCYIPELNLRRKYLTTSDQKLFEMVECPWEGVVPLVENLEEVEVTLYSEFPRIWKEKTSYLCELYVEKQESQNKNKKNHDHPQPQQD